MLTWELSIARGFRFCLIIIIENVCCVLCKLGKGWKYNWHRWHNINDPALLVLFLHYLSGGDSRPALLLVLMLSLLVYFGIIPNLGEWNFMSRIVFLICYYPTKLLFNNNIFCFLPFITYCLFLWYYSYKLWGLHGHCEHTSLHPPSVILIFLSFMLFLKWYFTL